MPGFFPQPPVAQPEPEAPPKDLEEWWKNSLINKMFVKPLVGFGQLAGEGIPQEQFGNISEENIWKSNAFAGVFPVGAALSRPVEGVLAANPVMVEALSNKLQAQGFDLGSVGPDSYKSFATTMLDEPELFTSALQKHGFDPVEVQMQNMLDTLKKPEPNTPWGEYLPEADPKNYPSPDEILKPKPLDTEKFPWLAAPAVPHELKAAGGILDRFDPQFKAVRDELYRRSMPQDQLLEVQRLAQSENEADVLKAHELSSSLRALLPEDWNYLGERMSTVVPHGFDTVQPGWKEKAAFRLENLPGVDEEALLRAQKQGYNLDETLLRGSRYPTDQFLDPSMKEDETGMFFAPAEPDVERGLDLADHYGRYIYPVVTRAQNPLERDFGGKGYGQWMNDFINEARAGGHDLAIARNMRDVGGLQDQHIVFDPKIIRSIYAKFDPERMGENNLLATEATGINPFPLLEEKKKKLQGGW